MTKISDFLKKNGISAADIDPASVLASFNTEMEDGLAGKNSSLAMIPTFVTIGREIPANKPVIVLDAGGTNLRIGTVSFDENGKANIDNFATYKMPGIEREFSKDEFFGQFAEYLAPVAEKSDRIAFCFSYPAEISPACDGKLIKWTKEIKAPGVVGEYVGANLLAALGDKGADKKITVLNDTIAALLAGRSAGQANDYDSYIGFILGTGTNTAYVEKNSNITKRTDIDPAGSQAINVESGNFAKAPQGRIDMELDADTADPGSQTFEKMISGRYQHELALRAMKEAAKECLFSGTCNNWICGLEQFSGKEMDDFLKGASNGPLVSDAADSSDNDMIKDLFNGIYDRAAKLTAINISAAAIKSGAGHDPARPICINIDGSTYYKAVGFKETTEKYLADILGSRGISYELVHADEAPIIGAAIAGLTQ